MATINKDGILVKFFRSFEIIISRHNLECHEKFPLLQQQLSTAPKTLIDSLDIDNQSCECAKLLLQQTFDQTEPSKQDVIKTLANLKLPYNGDPYKFIGDIRSIAHLYFMSSILKHNSRLSYENTECPLIILIVLNYKLIKIINLNPYQLFEKKLFNII